MDKEAKKSKKLNQQSGNISPFLRKKVADEPGKAEDKPGKLVGVRGESPKIGGNNLCKRCISFLRKWCYHGHKLQEMLPKRKFFLLLPFKTAGNE